MARSSSFGMVLKGDYFILELQREICSRKHVLFAKKVIPIGHGSYSDDVLYLVLSEKSYAVVHITRHRERSPDWPHTALYKDLHDWLEKGLKKILSGRKKSERS